MDISDLVCNVNLNNYLLIVEFILCTKPNENTPHKINVYHHTYIYYNISQTSSSEESNSYSSTTGLAEPSRAITRDMDAVAAAFLEI